MICLFSFLSFFLSGVADGQSKEVSGIEFVQLITIIGYLVGGQVVQSLHQ